MASLWTDFRLADPPVDEAERQQWLHDLAGFVLRHDVAGPGLEVAAEGDGEARALAERAVVATLEGLARVLDGQAGAAHNDEWVVALRGHACLVRRADESTGRDDEVVIDLDLHDTDGVAAHLQRWRAGDFGSTPLFTDRPD